MATKPTIALARFADQVGSDVVDPTSGLRDTGFVDNTDIEQGFVNALFKQLYLWALYLSDGALTGNHSISGALSVASTLTISGAEVVSGALTIGGQPFAFVVGSDLTFTANSGTDLIAKTAHGFETGDGQLRTTNTGGALPGGLAAGTDYYWIRIDADHGKLATSRVNALTGIAIDITSNGTGTHSLVDQPGTTRVSDATVTRNLTVGGIVSAAIYKHPTRSISIHFGMCQDDSGGSAFGVLNGGGSFDASARTATGAVYLAPALYALGDGSVVTNGPFAAPILLPSGERVIGIKFGLKGNGVANLEVTVSGPAGNITTQTFAAHGSTTTVVQVTLSPFVVAVDSLYQITFASSGNGINIGPPIVSFDNV